MANNTSSPDTLHQRRTVYRGRAITVDVEKVTLPNGLDLEIDIVRRPGAVATVPIDADGNVVMIRQYRHPTGGFLLEIPAGKLQQGEAPEVGARREVIEEVGLHAGTLTPMGFVWATPGMANERVWLFAATDLSEGSQALDPDEILTVERIPLLQAVQMARIGTLEDGKSVCAMLRLSHFVPQLFSRTQCSSSPLCNRHRD